MISNADGVAAPSAVAASSLTSYRRLRTALGRFPRTQFSKSAAAGLEPVESGIPDEQLLKRSLWALQLRGNERVLELGSRTGYETALLSYLAEEVVSLVPDAESAAARSAVFGSLGCSNVKVVVGHGVAGWPESAPYSAIWVAAGATHVPTALLDQLDLGGRLVIPLGDASGQLLELVHRGQEGFRNETLASCRLTMVPWASRRPSSFPWRRGFDP